MLEDGDRVAVGLSGGKDSVLLLAALWRLREFLGVKFELTSLTIDPCFHGEETDYGPVTALCEQLGIRHIIRRSDLGDVVFGRREEKNPCSLCAKMRRGMLHDMALENGCNKIALGHHADDAVETFVMNLFHEARVGCFRPVTWLSRKGLTMIRPLVLIPERDIVNTVNSCGLPVVKSRCPVDGATARQDMKQFFARMESEDFPGLRDRLFGAMRRAGVDGWKE